MLSSLRIPSDLVVETCFIGTLSIESLRYSYNVLSFCLEPININQKPILHKLGFSRIQSKFFFAEKPFVIFKEL